MKIVDHNIKYITTNNTTKCNVVCNVERNDQLIINYIVNNN